MLEKLSENVSSPYLCSVLVGFKRLYQGYMYQIYITGQTFILNFIHGVHFVVVEVSVLFKYVETAFAFIPRSSLKKNVKNSKPLK